MTACAAAMLMSAYGEDTPPIRAFVPAMAEQLGQQMYAQDQEAWQATDILFAAHNRTELTNNGLAGWITVTEPRGDVVRFIRKGPNGPELFYDILFSRTEKPQLSVPQDKTLSDTELAQHKARRLAVNDAGVACTGRANTIALRDPEGSGWLVWDMPALSDAQDANKAILGGTVRYTISADGEHILHKDKLSIGCGIVDRPVLGVGEKKAAMMWMHKVSLLPVETYIFANEMYKTDIYISTPNGRTWKTAKGHFSETKPDDPGMDGFASRHLLGASEMCFPIVESIENGKKVYLRGKDEVQVTERIESEDTVSVPLNSGEHISALICGRSDIVPLPNDYKLLRAGIVLYIRDVGAGHPDVTGVLEMVGGAVQFRAADGKFPSEVQPRIQSRLDQLQLALRDK